MGYSVMKVAWS